MSQFNGGFGMSAETATLETLKESINQLRSQNEVLYKTLQAQAKHSEERDKKLMRLVNDLAQKYEDYNEDVVELKNALNGTVRFLSGGRDPASFLVDRHVRSFEDEDSRDANLLPQSNLVRRTAAEDEAAAAAAAATAASLLVKCEFEDEPLPPVPEEERVNVYKMNRNLNSVVDLAREYFEGLPGKPSIVSLERKYGARWRSGSTERSYYARRMTILNRLIDISENPEKYGFSAEDEMTQKKATRVLENMRLGNNCCGGKAVKMSLNQLYKYLASGSDRAEDYSLTLKKIGVTSRVPIFAQRRRQMQVGE